jgi:hypothetical protein
MTHQEITKRYLTIDQKHIKPCTIESEDLLYQILKWWIRLSNSETILIPAKLIIIYETSTELNAF